jgi:uncharacterized phage-associated protein
VADVTLYVPTENLHRAAPVTGAGFQANFPIENALDLNRDSFARASTTSCTIVVDTDSLYAQYVMTNLTWAALVIRNYNAMNASPYLAILLESDANSAFSTPTSHGTKTMDGSTYLPIVLWTFGAAHNERYLRFTCSGSNGIQETAMVLWGVTYEIDWVHVWESGQQADQSFSVIDRMGGGNVLVRNQRMTTALNSNIITRQYNKMSDANLAKFRSAFHACKGPWLPMIVRDGTDDDADCKLVRWAQSDFLWTPIQNSINDLTVTWEVIPFQLDSRQW